MAWWNFLTSSEKVVDIAAGLVDSAAKGIDALFFTEEEKSQASMEAMQMWLRVQESLASENSIRSITRRLLACAIVFVFLGFLITAGVVNWFAPDMAEYYLSLAKELSTLVVVVAGFYFGYYGLQNVFKKKD